MNKRTEEELTAVSYIYEKERNKITFLLKCRRFGIYTPELDDTIRKGANNGKNLQSI